jgi:MFS family permease
MFNLRLFKQRPLALAVVVTAFVGVGLFAATGLMNAILMQSPTALPVGLGLTPTQAGLYGLISGAIGFAFSPVGGKVAAKFGAKLTLAAGIIVGVIGYIGYIFAVHDLTIAIVATIISGLGTALILVGVPNLIVEIVPHTAPAKQ